MEIYSDYKLKICESGNEKKNMQYCQSTVMYFLIHD